MTQPEALRLADELEAPVGTQSTYSAMREAAAELRRLHAELERCKQVCAATAEGWRVERDALLHTCTPRRLTDEVIAQLWYENGTHHHHFARAIERWLKQQ